MAKLENIVILALECYKLELTSKQEAVQSVVNHKNENYVAKESIEKALKNIEGENEDD